MHDDIGVVVSAARELSWVFCCHRHCMQAVGGKPCVSIIVAYYGACTCRRLHASLLAVSARQSTWSLNVKHVRLLQCCVHLYVYLAGLFKSLMWKLVQAACSISHSRKCTDCCVVKHWRAALQTSFRISCHQGANVVSSQ